MSNPLINPDGAYIAAAVITAGPAYIAARKLVTRAESTSHAEREHEATRTNTTDGLAQIQASLARIDGRLDEQHKTLTDIRDWQAEHTTEHTISEIVNPLPKIERRSN